VGSNPTLSIFINLGNYGIKLSSLSIIVGQNLPTSEGKIKEKQQEATEEDIADRHIKTELVRVKGYYCYLSPLRISADDSYEAPIDAMLPMYVPLISTTFGSSLISFSKS
jgi:hypothetical protein